MSHWGTKGPAAQYLDDLTDAQTVLTRCAFCRWRFKGRADQARAEALAHRVEKHPELLMVKRRRPGKYQKKAAV